MNVDGSAIHDRPSGGGRAVDAVVKADRCGHDRAVMSDQLDLVALNEKDCAIFRATKRRRILGDRIQDRLHVRWRARDRTQDF